MKLKKQTIALLIFMALTGYLSYEKFTGKEIDTAKLLQQVNDAQKTVSDLKTLFETCG